MARLGIFADLSIHHVSRGHGGHDGTEGQVLEDPQETEFRPEGLQPGGQAQEHPPFPSCVLACAWAVMASTTRSIFMNREPLTSTLAQRGQRVSTSAHNASIDSQ